MKNDDVKRMIEELKQSFSNMQGVQPMTGPAGSIFKMKTVSPSKYKFSRNWYIAEFNDVDYNAVREWCAEQFGPEDKFPNAWSRWQHRYEHQIFFRDEKDYVLFVLRWT